MKQDCQYSILKQNGLEQSLICSLTNKHCAKQRYCPTKQRLVNTEDWQKCTQLKKEGLQMANKKSYTKKVERAESKTETVDTVVIQEEAHIVEESAKYEVILATPYYYIINKNGSNITIKGLNNYKKGDIVSL